MKFLSVIIMFFSLSLQGQLKRERVIVYNAYPDMIEIVKTFRNDSLISTIAIFTSKNDIYPLKDLDQTYYQGDAKEFYSWLVDLESLLGNEPGTMKVLHDCDVFVNSDGFRKYLKVYGKEGSGYAEINLKQMKNLKNNYYNWCIKNKVNLSD
jgi:hypothetical protein